MIRAALREPLLHFLALGAGLFLLYGWLGPAGGRDERVLIDAGRIEQLAAGYARMHQRAPDSGELDALIADAIREEVLYREARALGLDQDDTIVRRRLRQKLEFVSEDIAPIAEPDDAQLQAYLDAHPDRFGSAGRYSFAHVFIDPARHGTTLDADVAALRAQLAGAQDVSAGALGDPFLLARRFDDLEADELSRLFGARFEAALRTLPMDGWQGPVSSGFGLHLVRVVRREAAPAVLADVRAAVRAEWLHAQRRAANERFYATVLARYEVTVERPATGEAAVAAAVAGTAR